MTQQETAQLSGHDLAKVQENSGAALTQLRQQLGLLAKERPLRPQEHIQLAQELQGSAQQ